MCDPEPTPEQVAASVALENSRRQYRLQDRVTLLVMHKPDAVLAARDGEPTLVDPKPTLAPNITKKSIDDFNSAMNPGAPSVSNQASPLPNAAPDAAGTDATAAAPAATPPAVPLQPGVTTANAPAGIVCGDQRQGAAPTAAPSGGSHGRRILTQNNRQVGRQWGPESRTGERNAAASG
jgi:outer membrane protein assembly factor BamD